MSRFGDLRTGSNLAQRIRDKGKRFPAFLAPPFVLRQSIIAEDPDLEQVRRQ